jgi:glycosyltransferase involved in cell wall biosynthesis
LISVIIPTRNRLAFLKEAVASVSAQDYPNRETIVVDDASEDGTWEWLSSLRDPQVRVFRPPHHLERSAARNLGLSKAQGEYAMFLDDDDLLVAGALTYLCEAFTRHPKALAVVGARLSFDDRGNCYRPPHPRWAYACKAWPDILFGWIPTQGQTLVRKDTLLAAGGWNEKWSVAEDHELWLRLVTDESVIAIVPMIVCKMRIHAGQTPHILSIPFHAWIELHRNLVKRLPSDLQAWGSRVHRAQRLHELADRYQARHQYRKAVRFHLLAIGSAPTLLGRPLPATYLLDGLMKSLVGLILGKKMLARAQQTKAFLRRAWKQQGALQRGES